MYPKKERWLGMKNEQDQPLPSNFDKELELRCDAGYKLYTELRKIVQHHALESAVTSWEIIGTLDVLRHDIMAQLSQNDNEEDVF